jgi:hypothetical protein
MPSSFAFIPTLRSGIYLAALVTAAVSVAPARADAQLFKKLKDAAASKAAEKFGEKAGEKVAGKAAERAGVESSVGEERPDMAALLGAPLTADTLDQVLKGLTVMASAMDERDRLAEQQSSWETKLSELRSSPEVQRWNERQSLVGRCTDAYFDELRVTRDEEVRKKMQADPMKYQAAAMKFAQEIAPLQARGDNEAVMKAQLKFLREVTGIDPRVDSTNARGKCGAVPPKPVQFAQIDSAEGRSKRLATQVRSVEAQAEAKAAAAAGIPAARFAQARERVLTWLYGAGRRWPDAALFASKKADIERVKKAL